MTLGRPTVPGSVLVLEMVQESAGAGVVELDVTSLLNAEGASPATFENEGDALVLIGTAAGWIVLANTAWPSRKCDLA